MLLATGQHDGGLPAGGPAPATSAVSSIGAPGAVPPALADPAAALATDAADTVTLPALAPPAMLSAVYHASFTTAAPGPAAQVAVTFALAQLGLPYQWGGDGPARGDTGFDCSGLTHAAYTAAGVSLPRTAQTQYDTGPWLPPGAALLPGDLVFYGTAGHVHHVGLALGGGRMINAPTFGEPVQIGSIRWAGDDYFGATRPSGAPGKGVWGLLPTTTLAAARPAHPAVRTAAPAPTTPAPAVVLADPAPSPAGPSPASQPAASQTSGGQTSGGPGTTSAEPTLRDASVTTTTSTGPTPTPSPTPTPTPTSSSTPSPSTTVSMTVSGEITSMEGSTATLTRANGSRITVDLSKIPSKPAVGTTVRVTGQFDAAHAVLVASSLTVL